MSKKDPADWYAHESAAYEIAQIKRAIMTLRAISPDGKDCVEIAEAIKSLNARITAIEQDLNPIPKSSITPKEYRNVIKQLYPKDRSKKFTR